MVELGQTVIDGVTVKFPAAVILTLAMEVALPQAVAAIAVTEPAVVPKFTVITFELVGADVMVAPEGTVHV